MTMTFKKIRGHNLSWWFWSGILAMMIIIQTSCITGPRGPQGPPGPAGNLALAGKACPQGGFLIGFDANGNILCGFAGPAALTTVDSVVNVRPRTAMAIGKDGLPVISYPVEDPVWHTEHLKVVHCGNASCSGNNTITTVDSSKGVGQSCDIAIGNDGLPVISYWDRTNLDLKVAHCGNAACTAGNTLTTVDSSGNLGYSTAITIGRDGLPVISYYDYTNHILKVVHCGKVDCSAGNTFSQVGSGLGGTVGETSIAIGGDGLPVIVYYDSYDLKVVHCGNVTCSANNTTTTVPWIRAVGNDNAIAIGADGLPVISFYDEPNGDLLVMHCGNASCSSASNSFSKVDEGILIGEWSSHWHSEKVGLYSAITIGRDGLPVISYLDHTNGHLKVVHCGDVTCSYQNARTTVDYNDSVGWYSAIAIGNDGLPVISYFDLVNRTLKVAHCVNAKCSP
jgi:hypothetical protein